MKKVVGRINDWITAKRKLITSCFFLGALYAEEVCPVFATPSGNLSKPVTNVVSESANIAKWGIAIVLVAAGFFLFTNNKKMAGTVLVGGAVGYFIIKYATSLKNWFAGIF